MTELSYVIAIVLLGICECCNVCACATVTCAAAQRRCWRAPLFPELGCKPTMPTRQIPL